jgi:hypothetical protein
MFPQSSLPMGQPKLRSRSLVGVKSEWKPMFEEFGHDYYLQGSEYKADVPKGEYDVWVSSPKNDSKYTLAIGETESFDFKEGVNALVLVPRLKRDFFGELPISFILSPFGIGYFVVTFIFASLFGFLYRYLICRYARKAKSPTPRILDKNIDTRDRAIRACIGLGLFLVAIMTDWSAWLLFFSGFCFFEAIFSWCGFYATIGRSTCPIE